MTRKKENTNERRTSIVQSAHRRRDAGLDTCFANPGTSVMQLVYEIGRTEAVRAVLCLEENVVTGAADGYARMAGKPAFTLLHVGSGFANGIANLHNAGRANTTIRWRAVVAPPQSRPAISAVAGLQPARA
jgi:Thiamine pyrophosphate enzyme, N-terminal TPP binding domain